MADIYDTTFRTLIYKCSSLVLPLLNETFSEHYTGNEKIVFDQNEQMIEVPEEAVRNVKVIKMKNYTAEEIIQKKLFILIPFYLFNYQKQFKECNDDPEMLEVILNDLRYLEKELNSLVNNGDLDTVHLDIIEKCTQSVSDQLAKNYDNVRKGVEDIMVGPIFDFPSTRILEKTIEEGIEKGIEKGIRKTAINMLDADVSVDIISKCTGLSLDEINKLKESVNSEAQAKKI